MDSLHGYNGTDIPVRGWVSQPNVRGTFDVILSCGLTIFLCGWSAICVNVPSSQHGKWDLLRDKWHLFCLAMLGPEFIFLIAFFQYSNAHAVLDMFQASGFKDWTIRHAFYADMGGFVFQPQDFPAFPIDGKQLHYLVTRGYVDYPSINKTIIDDKNKSDGLARILASFQIFWFTMNTIARPILGFAVTTLEVTTMGFIFCTFGILYYWRHKPMDVETAIVLESPTTIHQILIEAGPVASEPYRLTPLDFVSREEWTPSLVWKYSVNILKRMRVIHQWPKCRPVQRISSFIFPKCRPTQCLIPLAVAVLYSAIFFSVWNNHFPSPTERLLWRVSTASTIGANILGGISELVVLSTEKNATEHFEKSLPTHSSLAPTGNGANFFKMLLSGSTNNSPDKDPALALPIRSLIFTIPLMALFCLCRAFILLEDLISLRELPSSAYRTVDWTQYLPHFERFPELIRSPFLYS